MEQNHLLWARISQELESIATFQKLEIRIDLKNEIYTVIHFWFWDFGFKMRFDTFWIDSDQNFWLGHFFTVLAKNHWVPEKKILKGKIFRFKIFVLNNVSNHTKSIPKKIDQKFSIILIFGHFLLRMKVFGHFRIFLGRNKKPLLQTFCAILLQSFWAITWVAST